MAGYNPLNLGNLPGDDNGDDARTGGAKINAMFLELFNLASVTINGFRTLKADPIAGDPEVHQDGDKVEGWVDPPTNSRWVEGVIIGNATTLPDDVDDDAKFFITNQKIKTN